MTKTTCNRRSSRFTKAALLILAASCAIFCLISPKVKETSEDKEMPVCDLQSNLTLSASLVGRLGNQLFVYSSLYGLSHSTCRNPTSDSFMKPNKRKILFKGLSIPFTYNGEAQINITEKGFAMYDNSLLTAIRDEPHVHVTGYLQSFKYFNKYEKEIKEQFKLSKKIINLSEVFMKEVETKILSSKKLFPAVGNSSQVVNLTKDSTVTFVGVHVRRGDMIEREKMEVGYLTASVKYFQKAMTFFRNKYRNVHFLVATDDVKWVSSNLHAPDMTLTKRKLLVDFAILSLCDHVIMSVGTYGWWAGWLAGGDVIYKYPQYKPGSERDKYFRKEDFFPRHWIGINE